MQPRRRKLTIAIGGLFVLLSACSPSATPAPSAAASAPAEASAPAQPSAPAATTSANGTPSDTLVVAASVLPINFDGEKAVNIGNIEILETIGDHLVASKAVQNKDGLWEYDFTQTIPQLADSWDISDNGATFTFHLHHGVMSPYGNEFTADDVVWRWQRMWNLKANGLGFFSLADLKGPEDVVAVDKYTVAFHLQHANGMFLTLMQNTFMYFIDSVEAKKHITADDPWALTWTEQNAAVFGPYKVTQHTPGQQTVLEAIPNYYGGPVPLQHIIYREVPDSAVQSQLLQSGEVDLATGLDARQLLALNGPDVKALSWAGTAETPLVMNVKKPPFDKLEVRQAISYAIPYDDIISSVYQGTAARWKSAVPTVFPGYTDKFWNYDTNIDKAKALLAQAGLPNGFDTTLSYDGTFPDHEAIAILLKTALAKIGVNITINKLSSAAFAEQSGKRDLPFLIAVIFPGTPDVSFGIGKFLADPTGANFADYDNPQLDDLTKQSIQEVDQAKRIPIFEQMQQIVVHDAPWAFLALPGYHVAVRSNIDHVTYYPVNVLRLGDITKS
jgi:peptide/nickel transport system substrate-binding protein